MNWWTISGICLIVASGSSEFYSSSDDVVNLTADNFVDSVLNSDKVWVVEFYATWCSFSRDLVPTYREVATALKDFVNVGAFNCEESQAASVVCGQIYINYYPTILIFGVKKYDPVEYNGDKTVKDIIWAALYEFEKTFEPQTNTSTQPMKETAHK